MPSVLPTLPSSFALTKSPQFDRTARSVVALLHVCHIINHSLEKFGASCASTHFLLKPEEYLNYHPHTYYLPLSSPISISDDDGHKASRPFSTFNYPSISQRSSLIKLLPNLRRCPSLFFAEVSARDDTYHALIQSPTSQASKEKTSSADYLKSLPPTSSSFLSYVSSFHNSLTD